MKSDMKYTKEQAKAKKFIRLFYGQSVLLLLFTLFCSKILIAEGFSWRIFFCLLFLLCVCGLYAWIVLQRKKGRVEFFEIFISLGFFIWFCVIALILTL
jgi:hypothetical protein